MGRLCKKCGKWRNDDEWYPPRANGKEQAWCKPCYRAWHRARYLPKAGADDTPRACKTCGVSYRPATRRPSEFCSRDCKAKDRQQRDRAERLAGKLVRRCLQCGGEMPPRMRSDAKFCSEECNSNAHGLKRKLRARGGPEGAPGYVRVQIAERDKWRCGICGGAVSKERRWPDPLTGSLDHIVPVSQGGTSELANLRLTHLQCNVRRRDRGGGEQLALH